MSEQVTKETRTCACVSYDARDCIRRRYPEPYNGYDLDLEFTVTDRCECCCHDDEDDYDVQL